MSSIATVKSMATIMSFQDNGRPGWRRYGIAPSGHMDPYSAHLANRLVNNLPEDTVIEIGPGGGAIEFHHATWIAVTGAGAISSGKPAGNAAAFIPAGSLVTIKPTPNGLWTYLAIEGGWQAETAFGSTSFHSRSGIGQSIQSESDLTANKDPKGDIFPGVKFRRPPLKELRDFSNPPKLRITPGPHLDRCENGTLDRFLAETWQINPNGFDRTGYQLDGSKLSETKSIHSTPVIVGSIQLPPSGKPIVTMNDGPTVGGYPVIAVLHPEDVSWLAQTPPGKNIHFTLDE